MINREYLDRCQSTYGFDLCDALAAIHDETSGDWNITLGSVKNVLATILVKLKGKDYAKEYLASVINEFNEFNELMGHPPFAAPDGMLDGVADFVFEPGNEKKELATAKIMEVIMAVRAPETDVAVDAILGLDQVADALARKQLGRAKIGLLNMGTDHAIRRGYFDYK